MVIPGRTRGFSGVQRQFRRIKTTLYAGGGQFPNPAGRPDNCCIFFRKNAGFDKSYIFASK
jgi:hypothetical protein